MVLPGARVVSSESGILLEKQCTHPPFPQRPHAPPAVASKRRSRQEPPRHEHCRWTVLMKRQDMEQLSLRLFGAPQVACHGQPISLRFHKELALLIYLAGTNRLHTRLALAT